MKLIYTKSRKEVKVGDIVTNPDGKTYKVLSFKEPSKPSSTGKVFVEIKDGISRELYVSAIGAEWIDREDRLHEESILEVNEITTCHCNVCGALANIEVRFGIKYSENHSMTQSIRFCTEHAKTLGELLIKKTNN